jgi:hypothetical protein
MATFKADGGSRTITRHNGGGDNSSEIKMKGRKRKRSNSSNYATREELGNLGREWGEKGGKIERIECRIKKRGEETKKNSISEMKT